MFLLNLLNPVQPTEGKIDKNMKDLRLSSFLVMRKAKMEKINVKDARRNISHLLNAVVAGQEFVIVRNGKSVARLVPIEEIDREKSRFPVRSEFRANLPKQKGSSDVLIREIRDERG